MTANDRLPDVGRERRYRCDVDLVYSNYLAFADWMKLAEQALRAP